MKRLALGLTALLGAVAGGAVVKKLWLEKYRRQKVELSLAEQERDLLHAWLVLEQRGVQARAFFDAHACQNVAVFGMGRTGRRFADALGDMAAYGVELDNFGAVHERLTVYRLGDDPLPLADCMVICDMDRTEEKRAAAQKEFPNDIVTLSEVLTWLSEQHNAVSQT